jgi:hypothetical protein
LEDESVKHWKMKVLPVKFQGIQQPAAGITWVDQLNYKEETS